jgi:hypothetical protein
MFYENVVDVLRRDAAAVVADGDAHRAVAQIRADGDGGRPVRAVLERISGINQDVHQHLYDVVGHCMRRRQGGVELLHQFEAAEAMVEGEKLQVLRTSPLIWSPDAATAARKIADLPCDLQARLACSITSCVETVPTLVRPHCCSSSTIAWVIPTMADSGY